MFLIPDDLAPFADIAIGKALAMIEDAEAQAALIAPCITTDLDGSGAKTAAVRAVLRAAVLRWNEAGNGVVTQQTAGPFSQMVNTTMPRRGMFWPSEIDQLQAICAPSSGAFSIDTAPSFGSVHGDACSVRFGASCSCGADIAGIPIYEGGGW